MAILNGFRLFNPKQFIGHEGEQLLQGDIYYGPDYVGRYSQDYSNGEDLVIMNSNLRDPDGMRQKFLKIKDELADLTIYHMHYIQSFIELGMDGLAVIEDGHMANLVSFKTTNYDKAEIESMAKEPTKIKWFFKPKDFNVHADYKVIV